MNSKSKGFCFLIGLAFLTLSLCPLQAAGWGKNEQITYYENTSWNGVYIDTNGLNFTAIIPNYTGAFLENDEITLRGMPDENSGYAIFTFANGNLTPPKSGSEFVKMIQDANPGYSVVKLDSKKFGAKHAVDLIPSQPDSPYWRFLCSKDRIIQMGTSDANANRRAHFFNSAVIH